MVDTDNLGKVETLSGKRPHNFFGQFVEDYRAGRISRREFLAYSTGVGVADAGERSKLMGKMEKLLQDDAIMVQPLWRGLFNYSHDRVKNYTMHPSFVLQFDKVWLDA